MSQELDALTKERFRSFSNTALIARANSLPDFKWDDEGHELDRRHRESEGRFDYVMQGNRLVITRDEPAPLTARPTKASQEEYFLQKMMATNESVTNAVYEKRRKTVQDRAAQKAVKKPVVETLFGSSALPQKTVQSTQLPLF